MRTLSIIFILCYMNCSALAQEYYYCITTKVISNGNNQRFFVQSNCSPALLAEMVENNKMIVFDQTYAYLLASDKFEKISVWDDMISGNLIIRGDNIMLMQTLVGNPEVHKSSSRVFGDKQKDGNAKVLENRGHPPKDAATSP